MIKKVHLKILRREFKPIVESYEDFAYRVNEFLADVVPYKIDTMPSGDIVFVYFRNPAEVETEEQAVVQESTKLETLRLEQKEAREALKKHQQEHLQEQRFNANRNEKVLKDIQKAIKDIEVKDGKQTPNK